MGKRPISGLHTRGKVTFSLLTSVEPRENGSENEGDDDAFLGFSLFLLTSRVDASCPLLLAGNGRRDGKLKQGEHDQSRQQEADEP